MDLASLDDHTLYDNFDSIPNRYFVDYYTLLGFIFDVLIGTNFTRKNRKEAESDEKDIKILIVKRTKYEIFKDSSDL